MSYSMQDRRARVSPLKRFGLDVLGAGCLLALPGIWMGLETVRLEALFLGLGLSLVLAGLAGLCLFCGR